MPELFLSEVLGDVVHEFGVYDGCVDPRFDGDARGAGEPACVDVFFHPRGMLSPCGKKKRGRATRKLLSAG